MDGLVFKANMFLKHNSPTILTCFGAAGVIATAVMAAKASPKAVVLLENAEKEKGDELTRFEKVTTAAPVYIPSILIGTATITCIFGANVLSKRHQVALVSACALLDTSYKEYKNKVKELYGNDADIRVGDEIAKDRYSGNSVKPGKSLFYEEYSGRYFESTSEDVIRAEYELNKRMVNGSACLNEFYDLLGLDPTSYGDYIGWSPDELYETYWEKWITFDHRKVILDDGLECMIITMSPEPDQYFEHW